MTQPVWDRDDSTPEVIANGVDASTGRYALPPLPFRLLSAGASGRPLSPDELDELRERLHRAKAHLGVADYIEPDNLAQSGWGIVFAADDPDVDRARGALAPLLERRRQEAGGLYREFAGADGLRVGETGRAFLARHGGSPGPVDPRRGIPYYLLVVGPPTRTPFQAQMDLDARHAVGRLDLGGVDALAAYAEGTVRREQETARARRRAVIYGTRNPGDPSTQRSARHLATPLADALERLLPQWQLDRRIAGDATKDALRDLLHDGSPPSLLFAACHGARFSPDDPAGQRLGQGALVTQEWPGPMAKSHPLTAMELFRAADVTDGARLEGMIAFLFACFSAGTPEADEFLPPQAGAPAKLADTPFTASLAQRMLARGAAAVVGHVERAWTWSFRWPVAGGSTTVFESVLHALARGSRVGAAMEGLNRRYAEIAAELSEELRQNSVGMKNDEVVAGLWTALTDARNFIVLGDPAVRLALAADH